jgi:hypothetical protein
MSTSNPSHARPLLPALLPRSEPQMHISRTLLPRPPRIGVSIACESCRKRKVRCNGDRPQCANCTRNGVSCTYPLPIKDHELRQHIRVLETEQEANRKLIELLRSRDHGEASLILDLLRQDTTSIHGILRQVEDGDMLCDLSHQAGKSCS